MLSSRLGESLSQKDEVEVIEEGTQHQVLAFTRTHEHSWVEISTVREIDIFLRLTFYGFC